MIDIQNMKIGILTPPQIKNNGDFDTNTYIDTQGWSHLRVLFITGVITASAPIGSTAEGTAPLVEECDTTGGALAIIGILSRPERGPGTAAEQGLIEHIKA